MKEMGRKIVGEKRTWVDGVDGLVDKGHYKGTSYPSLSMTLLSDE